MILEMSDPEYWDRYPEHLKGMGTLASITGATTTMFVLGDDPSDPHAPGVGILCMPPGYVLRRHAHTCHRLEVILSGTLNVEGRWFGPGTVMTAGYEEAYGDHIAGPEGCTTVEVCSTTSGMNNVLVAAPDGQMVPFDFAATGAAGALTSLLGADAADVSATQQR